MKIIRKMTFFLLSVVILLGIAGCDSGIADTVNASVALPEQYSITYEVKTATGEVRTVRKIRDSDGNVYFQSGKEEMLFIKDGDLYALYEKDSTGIYVARGVQAAYNEAYVDSVSSEFLSYAEQSKKQFIPGMESIGEETIHGRACDVYGVMLGSADTGVSYSFYVDQETGICLGFDSNKSAGGVDLGVDGDVFTCTEFETVNVISLTGLLSEVTGHT